MRQNAKVHPLFQHVVDCQANKGATAPSNKKARASGDDDAEATAWLVSSARAIAKDRLTLQGEHAASTAAWRAQTVGVGVEKRRVSWIVGKHVVGAAAVQKGGYDSFELDATLDCRLSCERVRLVATADAGDLVNGTIEVLCQRCPVAVRPVPLVCDTCLVARGAPPPASEPLFPLAALFAAVRKEMYEGTLNLTLMPGAVRRVRQLASLLFEQIVPTGATLTHATVLAAIPATFSAWLDKLVLDATTAAPLLAVAVFRRNAAISPAALRLLLRYLSFVFSEFASELERCALDNNRVVALASDVLLVVSVSDEYRRMFASPREQWLAEDCGTVVGDIKPTSTAESEAAAGDDGAVPQVEGADEPIALPVGASRAALISTLAQLGCEASDELAAVWSNDFDGVALESRHDFDGTALGTIESIATKWATSPLIAAIETGSSEVIAQFEDEDEEDEEEADKEEDDEEEDDKEDDEEEDEEEDEAKRFLSNVGPKSGIWFVEGTATKIRFITPMSIEASRSGFHEPRSDRRKWPAQEQRHTRSGGSESPAASIQLRRRQSMAPGLAFAALSTPPNRSPEKEWRPEIRQRRHQQRREWLRSRWCCSQSAPALFPCSSPLTLTGSRWLGLWLGLRWGL